MIALLFYSFVRMSIWGSYRWIGKCWLSVIVITKFPKHKSSSRTGLKAVRTHNPEKNKKTKPVLRNTKHLNYHRIITVITRFDDTWTEVFFWFSAMISLVSSKRLIPTPICMIFKSIRIFSKFIRRFWNNDYLLVESYLINP